MSSSRLRSRLAHGDFDAAQAARVTENFVLIGTALPSLEKRDPNEGKPVWEQEVRDEQGRRRFHGAFTGGWSAGYFNTVGSKEGWTPSTFVSSRSRRDAEAGGAKQAQARPEDFMDEEDLAELEESRKLGHREGYAAADDAAKKRHRDDVLGDLLGLGPARSQIEDPAETGLVAPRSSLGHRILTRMGWRPGSGLGPRVTAKRRRWMDKMFSTTAISSPKPIKEAESATVPPPDTPMPALAGGGAKRDTHGLGWQPGGDSAATRDRAPGAQDRRRGQGFDISVLEDADEDDVADIYSQSESIQAAIDRRRSAAQAAAAAAPARIGAPSFERDALDDEEAYRWRDGKPLPTGFIIDAVSIIDSRQEHKEEDWFPPPVVPPQWKPDPVRVWSRAKSALPPPFQPQRTQGPHGAAHLQAADRAQMLGEARMPGPPPSLANYLPGAPPPPPPPPARHVEPTPVAGPKLEVATAKAALQGFIPFGNDEAKQKRYVAYLESQSDASRRGEPHPVPAGKTAQQTTAELEEFARSASIFKPLSSAMASRFASAVTSEGAGDVHAPAPGLFQPEAKSREEREAEAKRKAEEERERQRQEREANLNDRQRAARAQMFGHLTREVKAWRPPRLLCKRFGVPEPHSGAGREGGHEDPREGEGDAPRRERPRDEDDPFYGGGGGREDAFQRSDARRELKRGEARWEASKRELLGLVGERKWEEAGGQPLPSSGGAASAAEGAQRSDAPTPPSLETVGLGEDETQLRELDADAAPRPSREVFKSVFASDEEDSDPEDEDDLERGTKRGEALPLPSDEATPAAAPDLARPTFVPRRKRADLDDSSSAAAAAAQSDAPAGSKSTKKRKKEDKKKKTKKASGALTFDFDEDEDEDGSSGPVRPAPAAKKPREMHLPAPAPVDSPAGPNPDARTSPNESRPAPAPAPAAERRGRAKAADLF